MKLILERTEHGIYAYFENKELFKICEKHRGKRLKNPKNILDTESNLHMSLEVGEHMVIRARNNQNDN